jgi:2-C-methyl-D-erythritol 2,4-cyclodiphosphate synthase
MPLGPQGSSHQSVMIGTHPSQRDAASHSSVQVGIGFDSHPFSKERPLILGGVVIPDVAGLSGHSDADVLTHAVIDALLGAAGLGDIGDHFPDSDPRYKGISSLKLLARVKKLLVGAGFEPVHIDSTVLADHPPLGPYKAQIRDHLAKSLGVSSSAVNLKAKTTQGLGGLGSQLGMVAWALATVTRRTKTSK